MEIYQLRAFVAVAKHGSFTRAADDIHLSQPTVSGQIKALEEDLSVLLFDRKAGGVSLTADGTQLLQRAERILSEVRGFLDHANMLSGQTSRKVRLGISGDAKFFRLGSLLSAMRNEYPNIEIEIVHGSSGFVMDSVRKGALDCGYFSGVVTHPDVASTFLASITYRIAAPTAWADRIKDATWKEISAMPWVLTPETGAVRQMAMEMFREQGVHPKETTLADSESTVVDLVTSGVGLAIMRETSALAALENHQLVLWKNGAREASLSFIHLVERQNDPAILAATKMVRLIWP